MTTQVISLDSFPKVIAEFASHFPEEALSAIRRTALESRAIIVDVARKTAPYPPVDTGTYIRSWTWEPHEEGADIINDAAHAGVIEFGRLPGTYSPIDELVEWVIRKSRGPHNEKFTAPDPLGFKAEIRAIRAKFHRKAERATRDEKVREVALRAAFRISTMHFVRGMEPREVFQTSFPSIFRLLGANLDEALSRAAGRNWGVR